LQSELALWLVCPSEPQLSTSAGHFRDTDRARVFRTIEPDNRADLGTTSIWIGGSSLPRS
jgi:hypothetical protein